MGSRYFGDMSRWLKGIRRAAFWMFWVFALFLFGQLLKFYVIQLYLIPTGSMQQTIIPGDRVLVFKPIRGARYLPDAWWVPFSPVRRGDVVAFYLPETNGTKPLPDVFRTPYIKRCAGLPGDEVRITGTRLYVNGVEQQDPAGAMFRYRWVFADSALMEQAFTYLDGKDVRGINPGRIVRFPSRKMLESFASPLLADSVANRFHATECFRSYSRNPHPDIYPRSELYQWSNHNFGPLLIPRKGDSIRMTPEHAALYRMVVEELEGHRMEVRDGRVWVDDLPYLYYTFEDDYYFMLGDNRMDSKDSRVFGVVPSQNILGKAGVVVYSIGREPAGDAELFRPDRLFRCVL